jgi:hypothetical protein
MRNILEIIAWVLIIVSGVFIVWLFASIAIAAWQNPEILREAISKVIP